MLCHKLRITGINKRQFWPIFHMHINTSTLQTVVDIAETAEVVTANEIIQCCCNRSYNNRSSSNTNNEATITIKKIKMKNFNSWKLIAIISNVKILICNKVIQKIFTVTN